MANDYEPEYAVLNVQLGEILLVNAHLEISLGSSEPLLHFVPCQIVQISVTCGVGSFNHHFMSIYILIYIKQQ